jgi:hypothetical protein
VIDGLCEAGLVVEEWLVAGHVPHAQLVEDSTHIPMLVLDGTGAPMVQQRQKSLAARALVHRSAMNLIVQHAEVVGDGRLDL